MACRSGGLLRVKSLDKEFVEYGRLEADRHVKDGDRANDLFSCWTCASSMRRMPQWIVICTVRTLAG